MPPTPIIETKLLDFTNKEEELVYNGILNNIECQWRSAQALNGMAYQLQRFAILLRLRQVSVNPQIYINARKKESFGWSGPEFVMPSRKFDEISHLLRDSYQEKAAHRWIIFCQFHEEMELLSAFLKAFPFIGTVLQYHGGMSSSERDAAIEASKIPSGEAKQDVFLIQLKAGSTGLNLQHYDRIIFVSPWWTAALMDQAIARAVRMGQTEVVKVYHLQLAAEKEATINIDVMINRKADEKRKMLENMFLMCENYSS
jgi:SWI/SNF-related matrix-associated actin-dependent regulator of chromatin subfamily A member 5